MTTESGWYKDPSDGLRLRFWDGTVWTSQTRPLSPPESTSSTPSHSSPMPGSASRQMMSETSRQANSHIPVLLASLAVVVSLAALGTSALALHRARGTGTASSINPTVSPTTAPASRSSEPVASGTAAPPISAVSLGQSNAFTDVTGATYSVTAVRVIDPARMGPYQPGPDPGTKFVAVLFNITATGSQSASNDAYSTATVVGSNGKTYLSSFTGDAGLVGCPSFQGGVYQANPGTTVSGCVVFELPTAVTVHQISWSASGGFGGTPGLWNVG